MFIFVRQIGKKLRCKSVHATPSRLPRFDKIIFRRIRLLIGAVQIATQIVDRCLATDEGRQKRREISPQTGQNFCYTVISPVQSLSSCPCSILKNLLDLLNFPKINQTTLLVQLNIFTQFTYRLGVCTKNTREKKIALIRYLPSCPCSILKNLPVNLNLRNIKRTNTVCIYEVEHIDTDYLCIYRTSFQMARH